MPARRRGARRGEPARAARAAWRAPPARSSRRRREARRDGRARRAPPASAWRRRPASISRRAPAARAAAARAPSRARSRRESLGGASSLTRAPARSRPRAAAPASRRAAGRSRCSRCPRRARPGAGPRPAARRRRPCRAARRWRRRRGSRGSLAARMRRRGSRRGSRAATRRRCAPSATAVSTRWRAADAGAEHARRRPRRRRACRARRRRARRCVSAPSTQRGGAAPLRAPRRSAFSRARRARELRRRLAGRARSSTSAGRTSNATPARRAARGGAATRWRAAAGERHGAGVCRSRGRVKYAAAPPRRCAIAVAPTLAERAAAAREPLACGSLARALPGRARAGLAGGCAEGRAWSRARRLRHPRAGFRIASAGRGRGSAAIWSGAVLAVRTRRAERDQLQPRCGRRRRARGAGAQPADRHRAHGLRQSGPVAVGAAPGWSQVVDVGEDEARRCASRRVTLVEAGCTVDFLLVARRRLRGAPAGLRPLVASFEFAVARRGRAAA